MNHEVGECWCIEMGSNVARPGVAVWFAPGINVVHFRVGPYMGFAAFELFAMPACGTVGQAGRPGGIPAFPIGV
jgi:hypothetical protein